MKQNSCEKCINKTEKMSRKLCDIWDFLYAYSFHEEHKNTHTRRKR